MLRKIKTLVAAVLFSSALFTACTKDDAVVPGTDPGAAGKLTKILYDDGSFEAVSYNADGTIQKTTSFSNAGGTGQTNNFHFSYLNGLLSEIKADDASKFIYTYDATKRLTKVEYYNTAGTLAIRYDFGYTNEKATSMNVFFSATGNLPANPTYRHEMEYHENGNLKKITVLVHSQANNQLVKNAEYVIEQYDTKFNTWMLFESNPFVPIKFSSNNPLVEKYYNAAGNLVETVNYTYTYDDKGNPLTRKTVTKTPGAAEVVENADFHY